MIDLEPSHLAIARGILAEHAPECDALVFGSRIKGTAKPYSDLDLALRCDTRLSTTQLGTLREAFEASTLPVRVDFVDLQTVSPEFRKVIEERYEILGCDEDNT